MNSIKQFIDSIGSRSLNLHQDNLPLSKDPTMDNKSLYRGLWSLSTIMSLVDMIRSKTRVTSDMFADLDQLIGLSKEFEDNLSGWFHFFTIEHGNAQLYWHEPSKIAQTIAASSQDGLLSTYIHFLSPEIGDKMITYWTARYLHYATLHLMILQLDKKFGSVLSIAALLRTFGLSEDDQKLYSSKSYELAILILHSAEYFIRPGGGLHGVQSYGFALSVIQGYFRFSRCQRELHFLEHIILRHVEKRQNVPLQSFLADLSEGRELRIITPCES